MGSDNEKNFYERANGAECDKIGAISVVEEVLIDGCKDETGELIRAGLKAEHLPNRTEDTKKRPRRDSAENGDLLDVHAKNTDHSLIPNTSKSFVSRVRVRTLLSTYGWPLRKFCSLGELLRTLRDTLEGKLAFHINVTFINNFIRP